MQPHRRVPFHVRKRIEAELQRLEELDIIEKVDGPTPWVSPIVPVPKPKDPDPPHLISQTLAARASGGPSPSGCGMTLVHTAPGARPADACWAWRRAKGPSREVGLPGICCNAPGPSGLGSHVGPNTRSKPCSLSRDPGTQVMPGWFLPTLLL